MRGTNTLKLAGVIAKESELRYTPAGLAVLAVTLAGEEQITTDEGKEINMPWYHRVTVFGKQAEHNAKLPVGTGLYIEGRLDFSTWDDAGQKKNALQVIALRVEELDLEAHGVVADAKSQPRLTDALNEVTLIGNATRDAEIRTVTAGQRVLSIGVAVNERYQRSGGAESEKTHFVEVRGWNRLADNYGGLTKGTPVYVSGRLVTDSWDDKDGNKRFLTRVEATRIERLVPPTKTS